MKRVTKFGQQVVLTSTLLVSLTACAGWQDNLNEAVRVIGETQTGQNGGNTAGLENSEIITGLKEALAKGTTDAINQLGRTDGYWGNQLVKIAAPDELNRISKVLRQAGQDQLVDEFELALNRAAEKAVPEAAQLMGDAIRNMTFADARGILQGGDQAATGFFRRTTEQQLYQRFYPMVQQATNEAGVTQSYKELIGQAGFLAGFINLDGDSLDEHVTQEALDGLFTMIAKEEQQIRNDSSARTTDILREVFGR